jgi:pimeloyl-ACP methyl ester carboxylesterase
MACGYDNYAAVQDDWVSHGYVVLAPAHLDELSAGRTFGLDSGALLIGTRLAEVSLALDSIDVIEDQVPELKDRVDTRRAAVAGHSFGGMIAQIKAGLTLKDFKGGPEPVSFRDPRFVAAVIMSGVGPMPQMTDDAFSKLTLPLFASGGTEDLGVTGAGPTHPWRWRLGAYDLAPAGDKYAVWLRDGDHYLGGLICRSDRVNKPDPDGAAAVAAASRLFLDAYLRNDRKASEFLEHADLREFTAGRATLERK